MKKVIKLAISLFVIVIMMFLIKQNVTATKEIKIKNNGNSIPLEISSEIVQNVYNQLILLEDDFIKDNRYKYLYFEFDSSKKFISNEEKMYIAFNSLYQDSLYEKINNLDGTTSIFMNEENVKNRILELFIDDSFEIVDVDFSNNNECGVQNHLYKDGVYEFVFNDCTDSNEFGDIKLISADKDGNFIKMKVKSFYAVRETNNKGKYTDNYLVHNYNSSETVGEINVDEAQNNRDKVFQKYDINEYVISYKLKNDKYYLTSIEKA